MLKKEPVALLLEGCAYFANIDAIDALLGPRHRMEDKLFIIDIRDDRVRALKSYIEAHYPHKPYAVMRADMNSLPFGDGHFDFVIHNFTVNFNSSNHDDETTIKEIRRVLKPGISCCIFSVGVLQGGKRRFLSVPSGLAVFEHEATYYRKLFRTCGFNAHMFEERTIEDGFGYSRFILTFI